MLPHMRMVAILGRPNVGKSALFNRLAGRTISIVHDQPGVTRDRIYAVCRLGQAPFEVVDTGGIGAEPDPHFSESAREAALAAADGADALVLVVDVMAGLMPVDQELARRLRALGKPLIIAANKADHPRLDDAAAEFAVLGIDPIVPVSAAHGRGVAALVAHIEKILPTEEETPPITEPPRLAIVGRPNVGKSSLLNALLGQPRAIVSDIPGTTRDALDTLWESGSHRYILCDTAGIRHRSKHRTSVEVFSVMRSERAIRRADLCVLVLDASQGVTAQDKKIAGLIQKAGKGCLIVLNKWDLVTGAGQARSELLREHMARVREGLFFLPYAPVVIGSALTGASLRRILSALEKIRQHGRRRVGTGELNRLLQRAQIRQPPPSRGSRRLKIFYATQVVAPESRPFAPPVFLLFVNDPRLMTTAYRHYLEARLRERYEFPGLPLVLRLRGRADQVPK